MSANGDALRACADDMAAMLMNPWEGRMQTDAMKAIYYLRSCAAREDAISTSVVLGVLPALKGTP